MLDDFREWLSDNLRYILLGLAVLLVIIIVVCIFRLVGGSSSGSKKEDSSVSTSVKSDDVEASTEITGSGSAIEVPEAGEGLTKNDEQLLSLAKKYYNAVTAEDEATLMTIVEPWNDTVKEEVFALNEKFKGFENITTYSKDGPIDKSWLVYVYCECRVDGVDTGIPTLLNPLLVITTDSGELKISSDRSEYSDFINESNTSEAVQALIDKVNAMYDDLKASNDQVRAYSGEPADSSSTQDSTESQDSNSQTSTATSGTAMATANVNIRSEGSTNGSVLGTLYPGQEVDVVAVEGDWVHIIFKNDADGSQIDGYVSKEYLNM